MSPQLCNIVSQKRSSLLMVRRLCRTSAPVSHPLQSTEKRRQKKHIAISLHTRRCRCRNDFEYPVISSLILIRNKIIWIESLSNKLMRPRTPHVHQFNTHMQTTKDDGRTWTHCVHDGMVINSMKTQRPKPKNPFSKVGTSDGRSASPFLSGVANNTSYSLNWWRRTIKATKRRREKKVSPGKFIQCTDSSVFFRLSPSLARHASVRRRGRTGWERLRTKIQYFVYRGGSVCIHKNIKRMYYDIKLVTVTKLSAKCSISHSLLSSFDSNILHICFHFIQVTRNHKNEEKKWQRGTNSVLCVSCMWVCSTYDNHMGDADAYPHVCCIILCWIACVWVGFAVFPNRRRHHHLIDFCESLLAADRIRTQFRAQFVRWYRQRNSVG